MPRADRPRDEKNARATRPTRPEPAEYRRPEASFARFHPPPKPQKPTPQAFSDGH
jgi:hypothetical protein